MSSRLFEWFDFKRTSRPGPDGWVYTRIQIPYWQFFIKDGVLCKHCSLVWWLAKPHIGRTIHERPRVGSCIANILYPAQSGPVA